MDRANLFTKIPGDRVGALIGPNGSVKDMIEKKLAVELIIDSVNGGVKIVLGSDDADPASLFKAKEVATAIGRGFSSERAFYLFEDEELTLQVIDLREIIGRSRSDLKRLKGRIIGKNGKTREIIEELTKALISVYGDTISIIGYIDQISVAREAIVMLLQGKQHRSVYRFLYKKGRELKKKKFEIWENKTL